MIIFPYVVKADQDMFDLTVNKVFLQNDQGYWGKILYKPVNTQGFYFELLSIDNYYQQAGLGVGVNVFKTPKNNDSILPEIEIWNLLGGEKYWINETSNSFFQAGVQADASLSIGKISFGSSICFDDYLGTFFRHQLELKVRTKWGLGNIGVGNLLGSNDGYAFWIGFEL